VDGNVGLIVLYPKSLCAPHRYGFLRKSSASVELFTAIEQALAGKTYITPLVTKGVPLGVFPVPGREAWRREAHQSVSAKCCNSSQKAVR
jgi:hypothetical protein